MALLFITGMSGTGKSTVLRALARRGFRAVDTDYDGWTLDDGEPLWDEPRMDSLLREHEASGQPLVVSGCVRNQVPFYPRFDHVVLLHAPVEVMFERIAARADNPFGKSAAERDRIAADTAEVEPLLRESATLVIDTRQPLDTTVDLLVGLLST